MAGVLSVSGFDILGSKVLTRTDGITIDTFYLTGVSGGVSNNMRIREMFSRKVAAALADIHSLDGEVESMFYGSRRRKNESVLSDVFMRRESGKTVLEVRGRDGLGARHFPHIGAPACGIEV